MTEREKLIEVIRNALWRQHFAGDEDAKTIEYQKQAWTHDWDRTEQRAIDMLTALEAAGVRLVPVEADKAMMSALATCAQKIRPEDEDEDGDEWKALAFNGLSIYRAMLAASPYAPEGNRND